MKRFTTIIILTCAVLLVAACSQSAQPTPAAQVTGQITLQGADTVPEGSVIKVQLQDTSLADAPATTIAEQQIPGNGQRSPIEFTVPYDPAKIEDNHTYTISVRIEGAEGELLFINDTAIWVITNGAPTSDVVVPVIPVR